MQKRWLTAALTAAAVLASPVFGEEPTSTPPPATEPRASTVTPAGEPEPLSVPPTTAAEAGSTELILPPSLAQDTEEEAPSRLTWGAFADGYFAYNLNNPWTNTNGLRAFDFEHDQLALGLLEVWGEYAPDPIGFRLDLAFGPTAKAFSGAEPSGARDLIEHIQQAYVILNLDREGRTKLDLGRWNTVAGAEVIEPVNNFNYSRGLLYNWAQPFYHLGGRVTHSLKDGSTIGAAVHRGWNAVGDPNHDPGFILFGSTALNPELTFTGSYFGGEEGSPRGNGWRNFIDVVLAYNPEADMSYSLNLDYGQQGSQTWYGFAAAVKKTLNERNWVAFRGEYVRDDDGILYGMAADTYSLTATYTHILSKLFQLRAEYRHDFGSARFFADDVRPLGLKNQGTFLVAGVLSY